MYKLLKLEQYINQMKEESQFNELNDYVKANKKRSLKYTETALANYLKNVLKMEILEVQSKSKYGEHDEVTFSTKSMINGLEEEYVFIGRKYTVEEFKPRGNVLELREVKKGNLSFKPNKKFYLSIQSDNNPSKDIFLNNSVENLIDNKVVDRDLDLLLKLFSEILGDMEDFSCECEPGNAHSLNASVGDDVEIVPMFSNSIQVNFKRGVKPIRITYGKLSESELANVITELKETIENYKNDTLTMGNYNLSLLNHFMKKNVIHAHLDTGAFTSLKSKSTKVSSELETVSLYSEFVIGRDESQVEVKILYDLDLDEIEVHMNFLFQESVTCCKSTFEVLMVLDRLVRITSQTPE